MTLYVREIMTNFFKIGEKKPISFASVEMQKAPRNYVKFVVILILLIITIVGSFISQVDLAL